MDHSVEVFKAAVEFAKADEQYLTLVHKILHRANGQTLSLPSPEELKRLAALRSKRDELEDRFFAMWLGQNSGGGEASPTASR